MPNGGEGPAGPVSTRPARSRLSASRRKQCRLAAVCKLVVAYRSYASQRSSLPAGQRNDLTANGPLVSVGRGLVDARDGFHQRRDIIGDRSDDAAAEKASSRPPAAKLLLVAVTLGSSSRSWSIRSVSCSGGPPLSAVAVEAKSEASSQESTLAAYLQCRGMRQISPLIVLLGLARDRVSVWVFLSSPSRSGAACAPRALAATIRVTSAPLP